MSGGKRAAGKAATDLRALLAEAVRDHRRGRLERAGSLYGRILKAEPGNADALHLLGLVRHQRGDQAGARALIEDAIGRDPRKSAYRNSLGLVRLSLDETAAAAKAFAQALELDPLNAEAFNNLGNAEQKMGRLSQAVAAYDRALELRPDYAEAHCNKGRALHGLDALDEAASELRRALALRPDYAKAHRFLGDVLAEGGRVAEAEASFAEAQRLNPADAETLAALAALLERASRLDEALAMAEQALRAAPGNIRAGVVAARCERRSGRPEDAVARLRALAPRAADGDARAHVAFEIATALDRLGEYAGAYKAYAEANDLAAQSPQARAVDRAAMPRLVAALRARFTAQWVASWPQVAAAEVAAPVFLIGFPRSGTTLLDQILDSHPALRTMEEKPAIDRVRHAVAARPGGYPDALAALGAADLDRLRAIYFAEAERAVGPLSGAILVDKMPLNTVDAGLIVRLFPAARFLLSLRHPCDVVLSGFMQAFKPNPSMVQFDTLRGSAAFYASVMELWRHYESVLPLNVHRVRYEDLVADFAAETGRILDFLGLPWDDAVLGYAERARGRAIATPSYHQVVQPIYARSVGRWRNYRAAYTDVLPLLRPSLEAFGYEAE